MEKLSSLILVISGASSFSGVGGSDLGTPAGILVGVVEDSSTSFPARSSPLPDKDVVTAERISESSSAVRCLR